MQTIGPWMALKRDQTLNLNVIGCMGSAASIGLGIALGAPQRRVLVLDGDGSLLMQLGSLVTIAEARPENLYHFVFENGVYETSGNQGIPARGTVDFVSLALAAGYDHAASFATAPELENSLGEFLDKPGPALARLVIDEEPWKPAGPAPAGAHAPLQKSVELLRSALER
jgi:phosphonopyruvate decarboxylase